MPSPQAQAPIAHAGIIGRLRVLMPGLLLCAAVVIAAEILEWVEVALFGRAWLESLVLAILIGTLVRSVWTPPRYFNDGIAFSAKMLLEVAVMLLGASLSLQAILAAGPVLLVGIAVVVALSLAFGYGIGRALGLPPKMSVLVACGNSICGNSAIAAAAPVIGAGAKDVASSIAFTAVLGVAVVLLLPLLIPLLGLTDLQYGVLAGLTVYAVPQVLAATAPVAALSVQVGTLVKLVRVLMLGPIVLGLSLVAGRVGGKKPPLSRLVPWFILGFLALAVLRAMGAVPEFALGPISTVAGILTVVAMAALGLGVDVRMVASAGARVTATVVLSLLALGLAALGLIQLLPET
ncbi:YeiH family protein [Roseomonas marmotae]|uniref:Sulfate exporter family transporter n=1 Tax=Roseomonas marmotae TaxID=2768161 RepID=A0ABS3KCC5_9PROT|nr:putative sulfate exporter family transporter [Roseomonas marmotae]MBO1074298.1 putative sulfate exporter family transporter [Roseomonas marmotae]QTI78052.1 putative sulfate exporter family transporter [Roseomonas marmotae]